MKRKARKYQNIEDMLSTLEADDRGRYFICKCPECDVKEAFIYKNNLKFINCNRESNCGERTVIEYQSEEEFDNKYKETNIDYPNLTKKQLESLDWISRYVKHFQQNIESPTLDNGFRGLSRDVTNQFVAEIPHIEGFDVTPLSKLYERTKDLTKKDYSKSKYMLNRNIVIPITDKNDNVERILLRSTLDENAKPKEIQLVLNPSKETKDFFVDIKEEKGVLVISEALFDGLSFREVYKEVNLLSLTGVNRTKKTFEFLEENRDLLNNKRIIVAMDNDEAGKQAEQNFLNFLEKRKIGLSFSSFEYGEVGKDINDPNSFLLNQKEDFIQQFRNALKKQLNEELAYKTSFSK